MIRPTYNFLKIVANEYCRGVEAVEGRWGGTVKLSIAATTTVSTQQPENTKKNTKKKPTKTKKQKKKQKKKNTKKKKKKKTTTNKKKKTKTLKARGGHSASPLVLARRLTLSRRGDVWSMFASRSPVPPS